MAFRESTTFVIGAGASAEFGLPVGTGLAAEIKKSAVMTDYTGYDEKIKPVDYMRLFISEKFRGREQGEASEALYAIQQGIHTAVSIDAFIHRNRKNAMIERLGKVLIALEVLKAEERSTMSAENWQKFHVDPNYKMDWPNRKGAWINPDYTWIGHFFRILCDGVENPDEVGRNVKVICFNYDRCIEHYLVESLAAAYRISHNDALAIVENKIEIIHPYGYLGRLDTRPNSQADKQISFGFNIKGFYDVSQMAETIQTYTEQAHDVENVEKIHDAIEGCKNLVFLGFGFNNQNLDLLRVKHTFTGDAHPKNIYSTGYGLYQQIDATLKRRILDLFMEANDHGGWLGRVHVEYNVACQELFEIYNMDLASFIQNVVTIDVVDGKRVSRVKRFSQRIS